VKNIGTERRKMRILVTGSRTWDQTIALEGVLAEEFKPGDIMIHGGAIGADKIASEWAKANGIEQIEVKPVKYSSVYFLYRDVEMVGMCDRVLAFWDGKSRGTRFTMEYAALRKKPVNVWKRW